MLEKFGSPISGATTRIMFDRPRRRLRAMALVVYPVIAIAWLTFSLVEFATFSGVWIARDTVAIETCAIRATSSIVAGLDVDTLALTRRWQFQQIEAACRWNCGQQRNCGGHYTDLSED